MSKNNEVVVIGAGIAGLCTSYFLTKKKIYFVILNKTNYNGT